jgi:hypothetical protein
LPLRQAPKGQAGLRLRSGFHRASERFRRAGEITTAELELAELVGRLPDLSRHVVREEVVAR